MNEGCKWSRMLSNRDILHDVNDDATSMEVTACLETEAIQETKESGEKEDAQFLEKNDNDEV